MCFFRWGEGRKGAGGGVVVVGSLFRIFEEGINLPILQEHQLTTLAVVVSEILVVST